MLSFRAATEAAGALANARALARPFNMQTPISLMDLLRRVQAAQKEKELRQIAAQMIDEKYDQLGGPKGRLGAKTSELIIGAPGQFTQTYRGGKLVFTGNDMQVNLTDGAMLRLVYQGIHCFGNPGGIENSDAYAIISLFGAEQALEKVLKVPEDGTDDLYKNFSAGDSSTQGQITILGTELPHSPQTLTLSTQVFRAGILGGHSQDIRNKVGDVLGKVAAEAVGLIGLGIVSDQAEEVGQAIGKGLGDLLGLSDTRIDTFNRTFKTIEELTALPPSNSLNEGGIAHNFATGLITDGDASYKMYFDIEVLPIGPAKHS